MNIMFEGHLTHGQVFLSNSILDVKLPNQRFRTFYILVISTAKLSSKENINKREDTVLTVINHLLKNQEQQVYYNVEKPYIYSRKSGPHIQRRDGNHS